MDSEERALNHSLDEETGINLTSIIMSLVLMLLVGSCMALVVLGLIWLGNQLP